MAFSKNNKFLMQDFFFQEDPVDDFKSKQINSIFFSNKSRDDNIENNDISFNNDEYYTNRKIQTR